MPNKRTSHQTIGGRIFSRLLDVIPDFASLESGDYGKSEAAGFMALHLDVLHIDGDKVLVALAHNYKHPSGDMIPDPDMQVVAYRDREYAEAVSYQDFFGYKEVWGGAGAAHASWQREMNSFLFSWLGNLIEQGHCVKLRSTESEQHPLSLQPLQPKRFHCRPTRYI